VLKADDKNYYVSMHKSSPSLVFCQLIFNSVVFWGVTSHFAFLSLLLHSKIKPIFGKYLIDLEGILF